MATVLSSGGCCFLGEGNKCVQTIKFMFQCFSQLKGGKSIITNQKQVEMWRFEYKGGEKNGFNQFGFTV